MTYIEYKVDATAPANNWLMPWIRCNWDDFAANNPDDAPQVLADLVVYGRSIIGGGAAPYVTIRRANAY